MHGIVFQHMRIGLNRAQVIDGDDLEVCPP